MQCSRCNAAMLCLAIGFSLFCQSTVSSQEQRTWKDTTGKFSVDAVLNSQDENSVSLKTTDGRLVNVPKAKLSKIDLDYLQALSATPSTPSAAAAEQMLTAKLGGGPIAGKPKERLSDFLSRTGTPVYFDISSLNAIGVTPGLVINTDVDAPSLADQLDTALAPLHLTWYRLRTVLVVASKEKRSKMETFAYRIPIPGNDVSAVRAKLEAVERSSWESLGGSGSIAVLPGAVVIRQTPEIHRQLARQLKLRPLPHRYVHPLDNQIVSVQNTRGNLDAFVKQLGDQLKRNISVADSAARNTAFTVNLTNVTVADALDLAASRISGEWLENPQGLELVSKQYANQQLEQRRVTIPFGSPQVSSLIIQSVMQLVEPDSWAPLGGPGNIRHAGGKNFHVSQTQPKFRELDQLIADLSVGR
ncbi:SHD1 domain-containing protein [Novipirellula sp.]|uniref:SHD1 domain-containing protein n=1 Tax=Novipirellula sp. TaxID=2795430 RepID=UPI00356283CB